MKEHSYLWGSGRRYLEVWHVLSIDLEENYSSKTTIIQLSVTEEVKDRMAVSGPAELVTSESHLMSNI